MSRFRARIKQLQRLEFPAGVNVGRGAKMPYTTEHLFKLIIAFELIDKGMTAKPASMLIERHWPRFKAGIAAAATAHAESSLIYAHLSLNALTDTSGACSWVSIDDENSRLNLNQLTPWGEVSYIAICLTKLTKHLLERTEPTKRFQLYFVELELREWAQNLPKFDAYDDDTNWFRLAQFGDDGVVKGFGHGSS